MYKYNQERITRILEDALKTKFSIYEDTLYYKQTTIIKYSSYLVVENNNSHLVAYYNTITFLGVHSDTLYIDTTDGTSLRLQL